MEKLKNANPDVYKRFAQQTWIQADLHTENYGTTQNSRGKGMIQV
jgi:uncharacterized protein (DUF2252 family)